MIASPAADNLKPLHVVGGSNVEGAVAADADIGAGRCYQRLGLRQDQVFGKRFRHRREVGGKVLALVGINLNPAVDLETATGFAAPYNWGEQLKPVRGAAAGRAGGPSGSV